MPELRAGPRRRRRGRRRIGAAEEPRPEPDGREGPAPHNLRRQAPEEGPPEGARRAQPSTRLDFKWGRGLFLWEV